MRSSMQMRCVPRQPLQDHITSTCQGDVADHPSPLCLAGRAGVFYTSILMRGDVIACLSLSRDCSW